MDFPFTAFRDCPKRRFNGSRRFSPTRSVRRCGFRESPQQPSLSFRPTSAVPISNSKARTCAPASRRGTERSRARVATRAVSEPADGSVRANAEICPPAIQRRNRSHASRRRPISLPEKTCGPPPLLLHSVEGTPHPGPTGEAARPFVFFDKEAFADEYFRLFDELYDTYNNSETRILLAPCWAHGASEAFLHRVRAKADERGGVMIHMHLLQSPVQKAYAAAVKLSRQTGKVVRFVVGIRPDGAENITPIEERSSSEIGAIRST